LRKFRDTVVDIAGTLGHPVTPGRQSETRASVIKGLRLVRKDEPPPEEYWKARGGIEARSRMDRKDSGKNLATENA
jgi:hypothetical protein